MIKDFKKATEQLKELAQVLNSIKSEAVQLKLIEFFMAKDFEMEVQPIVAPAAPVAVPAAPVVATAAPVVEEVVEPAPVKKQKKEKPAKAVKPPKAPKPAKVEKPVETTEPVEAPKPVETVVAEVVIKPKTKGRPRKEKVEVEKVKVSKKRIPNRPGPSIILNALLTDNFFTENRTIGHIVEQCDQQYHYKYKSTDLSGTLAKLAKEGVLSRSKNPSTNQFEYIKS